MAHTVGQKIGARKMKVVTTTDIDIDLNYPKKPFWMLVGEFPLNWNEFKFDHFNKVSKMDILNKIKHRRLKSVVNYQKEEESDSNIIGLKTILTNVKKKQQPFKLFYKKDK